MSDTQRDREERQHVIKVLQNMVDWMEAINYIVATPERRHALGYAIASIETDLKYDLLYEETSGQADKPTTKDYLGVDYLGVDAVSRQVLIDWLKNWTLGDATPLIDFVKSMPPVTLQLSSGLEKNSKKLEKDFGELDCISRSDVLKLMQDNWHTHNGDWAMQESMDDIRALPAVTPQEPKRGHWISHREHCEMNNLRPSGLGSYFWCSECDCGIDSKDFARVNYNYCPNCGRRME